MIEARRFLGLLLSASLGVAGCAQGGDEGVDVGVTTEALSACNETVPATRNIDGIPAYAQCDATESSAIYSNNGIDTATTSMGTDWVRTQYSGGYQCTEFAHRYLYFKWQVKWIPNGNAGAWCDTMPPANSGMTQTMAPVHGDIMVLAPGSCGADATTGHVNVVDLVDAASGKLTNVEQNGARRGTYMQSCAKCFLHVVANNGMNPGTTLVPPPAAGAAATTGSSAAGAPAQAGSAAPPKRPAPAGSAAPPPAAAPPAAPAPTGPIAGAAPSAAGSTAPPAAPGPGAAGSGANTTTAAVTPVSTRSGDAADSGCSVSTLRGSAPASQPFAAGVALALVAIARVRRRRRARGYIS
jgi:MYXO-CTERM domain-containing protein